MAPYHLYNFFLVFLVFLVSRCIAQIAQKRELVRSTERAREEYHFIPPLGSTSTQDQDELEMLNVVLLASVDGKLHALNRSTGDIIWSMSSSEVSSVPSTFGPLVRTQHATPEQSVDPDDETQSEFYIIEPQSGDIFVMSNSTGPLQRLPFSIPQLVEMSPYSFAGDEDSKMFVGRKETSLLLLELETGKVKATINSQCPWDPFEDPFEDLKDAEDEIDLEQLERKPPKPEKPTEIFIGRTDYHISIHTRTSSPSSPKPPIQNLSFSTYGPNNQDNALQTMYRRTLDDVYIQPSSDGQVLSFRITNRDSLEANKDHALMWAISFTNPIVAVMDVVKDATRQHPFILLQPTPRFQDVFPSVDLDPAAYVGIVEETGSLFAMSPDRFPLVVFGDADERKTLEPPEEAYSSSSGMHLDVDSITKARKLRALCQSGSLDPRCMTGFRKLESDSRSRLSRLLDGVPSVQWPAPALSPAAPQEVLSINDVDNDPHTGFHINASELAPSWDQWIFNILSVGETENSLQRFLLSVLFISGCTWFAVKKVRDRQTFVAARSEVERTSEINPGNTVPTAELPISENALIIPPTHDVISPVPDDMLDGDETDRDDVNVNNGKRKLTRRRRGKKKKGAMAETPEFNSPDVNEENRLADASDSAKVSFTISLPTSKDTTAPPNLIVSDTVLGFGSHGTVVFRGSLQGRAVAVKRLLQDFVTLASREVSILEESDDHPNVIRYYYQEAHANFLYIAIELCPASLADIIERPDNFKEIAVTFDPKRALRQITSGLRHLHSLKIIHRDIKPQNILISSAKKGPGNNNIHRMLISDFGLCKKLDVDQTSFMPTAFGAMAAGTVGWRAPEILRGEVELDDVDASQSSRGSVSAANGNGSSTTGAKPKKLTKSVDIFALGCLFYYSLTGGGHPYGDKFERDSNIIKDAKSLDGLEHFGEEGAEAVDLIQKMLNPQPSLRPDTESCLLHPYFWDAERRLGFLQDASDRFEIMCREPRERVLVILETDSLAVLGQDWRGRLDKAFLENLGKFRKYDGRSVQDLLRALRNKKHHYQDLPDNVKRQLNPMPEGYLAYFTRRFPRLFMHVHSVIEGSSLRQESMFRSYFELSEQ